MAQEQETRTYVIYGAPPNANQGTYFCVSTRYQVLKPIGSGTYGVVCAALDQVTGKHVAVKKVTRAFTSVRQMKRTLREIKILRTIRHENVLSFIDVVVPNVNDFEAFNDLYIVSELMETDLHQIIASPQKFTDQHIQFFVYQILRGLKYVHSCGVMHRDLKPSNLVVNTNCHLKLCDFGMARMTNPAENHLGFLTEYVATRYYRAPEVMLSWKKYTKAIDVWSVGCILAELLGRRPLFPGKDYIHQLQVIFQIIGTPSPQECDYIESPKAREYIKNLPLRQKVSFQALFPHASRLAIDLLERMLTFNPEKRISVEAALSHPYLSALHDPKDEPVADHKVDFAWEKEAHTKDQLKGLLWQEVHAFKTRSALGI